jgi:hypothetical protein
LTIHAFLVRQLWCFENPVEPVLVTPKAKKRDIHRKTRERGRQTYHRESGWTHQFEMRLWPERPPRPPHCHRASHWNDAAAKAPSPSESTPSLPQCLALEQLCGLDSHGVSVASHSTDGIHQISRGSQRLGGVGGGSGRRPRRDQQRFPRQGPPAPPRQRRRTQRLLELLPRARGVAGCSA